MVQDRQELVPGHPFAVLGTMRWLGPLALAVAVGIAYFLAARLSLGLLTESDGVAVFWPAAGVSSGMLIALGRGARIPVAVGTMAATIAANLLGDRNFASSVCFAVCNAAEALITAGLIERYFDPGFSLDRLRNVLGLLGAAIIATTISGSAATAAYKVFHSPTAPTLAIWHHWFASDFVGLVAVAPLAIGFTAALPQPPARGEFIEGTAALIMIAVMTGIIISLPPEPWKTVVPGALLFPVLLWLAARCRPVYAAAGVFMVSLAVAWTTISGIGHFGDPGLSMDDRIMQAQAVILVAAIGAYVLAALFAERRENEARLARSNMMLERQRSNKLMSLEATAASISHEMKQPLTAITANGLSALRFLERSPPDLDEARSALSDIVSDGFRVSGVLDNIRALFGRVDRKQERIDVNEAARAALRPLRGDLSDHSVAARVELAPELPAVMGHRGQLEEVVVNLLHNAIEAMDTVSVDRRVLTVRTRPDGANAVIVEVEDRGPGIDPKHLESMFDAFVTTKPHGTGLGLAICRMIIERHGGQLSAVSDGKRGALFRIVLPIGAADKQRSKDTSQMADGRLISDV
jgi:signal transduction histidine kinase